MTKIREIWNKVFEKAPPLGYLLRQAYNENWIRVHYLPESKRYPENAQEWDEVFARGEKLVKKCFSKKETFTVIIGFYDDDSSITKNSFFPRLQEFGTILPPDGSSEVRFFYFVLTSEDSKVLKDILFNVVNEGIGPVVFFDENRRTALAPYDGGFDIISYDSDLIEDIRHQMKSCLSTRADGL